MKRYREPPSVYVTRPLRSSAQRKAMMSVTAIYQQSEASKMAFGMNWWDN
jgi:hypothetical protein